MKTWIFSLVLMLIAGMTNAQEITELKEAKVNFAPLSSEVSLNGDYFIYKVNDISEREFERDPIAFLNNHFDAKRLVSVMRGELSNSFMVTLKSRRGTLAADFNPTGELVRSTSKFKNILLPRELRRQLYRDYKGWEMVKNLHITRGRDGVVELDFYKIKLERGKERKTIKIEVPKANLGVATN